MSSGWVNMEQLNELDRLVKNIKVYGGEIKYSSEGISILIDQQDGGGTDIYWAKILTVTDANIYTADIYYNRENEDADEEGIDLYVRDIVDELAVNDWIPVQSSTKDGYDYENAQQLGAVG